MREQQGVVLWKPKSVLSVLSAGESGPKLLQALTPGHTGTLWSSWELAPRLISDSRPEPDIIAEPAEANRISQGTEASRTRA